MIETYNEYHLGDNLIHLNWLRRTGVPSIHYCHPEYIPQLEDLTENRRITLKPLSEKTPQAIDSWINADGSFNNVPYRRNWVFFHLQHFSKLARKLNVKVPTFNRNDLLLDYPALIKSNPLCKAFDFLIINSQPRSGQFPAFNQHEFKVLTCHLAKSYRVITTEPTGYAPSTIEAGLSVSQIGSLSRFCHSIISVNTGPMWPTFNPYTNTKLRIIYCNVHHFPLTDHTITINNIPDTYNILNQPSTP